MLEAHIEKMRLLYIMRGALPRCASYNAYIGGAFPKYAPPILHVGTTPSRPLPEIGRLPEKLLSAALARTSPRDACRAAAVSPAFRAAADSDFVWARFLPHAALPPLADGELPAPTAPPRKKDLFLRFSDSPDRKSTRLNSSHRSLSRMPSSA